METDVENLYFDRPNDPGDYRVSIVESTNPALIDKEVTSSLSLHNGEAFCKIMLPHAVECGDQVKCRITINDSVIIDRFVNDIEFTITEKTAHVSGAKRKKINKAEGGDSEGLNQGLGIPDAVEVKEENWHEHDFDALSALKISQDGDNWTFFINIDNKDLLHEIRASKEDAKLLHTKYISANVLVGLALLDEHKKSKSKDDENVGIDERVSKISRAISPFLIPMINGLGGLEANDMEISGDGFEEA